jgi:prepilin-type N-terminal cleavage/methylation domain-containing protein
LPEKPEGKMSTKQSAFTLIELLVVIAIIAILAAILFPVFAQAKVAAKKTQDMAHMKQTGTSLMIYATDYDDLFPLQAGRDCDAAANGLGTWNFNSRVLIPADWNIALNAVQASGCTSRVKGAWGLPQNQIYPYLKNSQMFAIPVARDETSSSFDYSAANKKVEPYRSGYSMNGLLTQLSQTAITSVSTTPLWWPGFGTTNRVGNTYTNPFLICADPNAGCVFNGNGAFFGSAASCNNQDNHNTPGFNNGSQSKMGNVAYGTVWAYSKSQNWVFADTHAKTRRTGTGDSKNDPFVADPTYLASGFPSQALTFVDSQCHVPIFRPDLQP